LAYIGNIPKTANFAIDTFNGDNATVNFTLRDAPATTSAILVFVGGIRQQTDSYTLSGTTLQFTEAPPTGTNNIQVLFLGIGTTTTVPADGTVSTIKIGNQAVTGDKVAVGSLGGNVIIAVSKDVSDQVREFVEVFGVSLHKKDTEVIDHFEYESTLDTR
jgi:hypothetical protein